jgi:hypothetical protein
MLLDTLYFPYVLQSTAVLHLHGGTTLKFTSHGSTVLVSLGLLFEVPRSHSGIPHPVGLLWTRDRPVTEPSTWQCTTLTRDIHATSKIWTRNCRQASGCRPTPSTARPPVSAPYVSASDINSCLNINSCNKNKFPFHRLNWNGPSPKCWYYGNKYFLQAFLHSLLGQHSFIT